MTLEDELRNLSDEKLEEIFDKASAAVEASRESDQQSRKDPEVAMAQLEAESGIRLTESGRNAFLARFEIFRSPNVPRADDPFDPEIYARCKQHLAVLFQAANEVSARGRHGVH